MMGATAGVWGSVITTMMIIFFFFTKKGKEFVLKSFGKKLVKLELHTDF